MIRELLKRYNETVLSNYQTAKGVDKLIHYGGSINDSFIDAEPMGLLVADRMECI